jgi:hypothetical protein
MLAGVRHSDFWRLMDDEFGAAYARTLAGDQVIAALGDRTPAQALADGVRPRDVWDAVCDALHVPPERRLGVDPGERARRRARAGGEGGPRAARTSAASGSSPPCATPTAT